MGVPRGHTASKRSRQDLNQGWALTHFARRLSEDRRSARQEEEGRDDGDGCLASSEAVLSHPAPPTELISLKPYPKQGVGYCSGMLKTEGN